VHSPSLIKKSLDKRKHIGVLDASEVPKEWQNHAGSATGTAPPEKKPNLEDIINLDDFEKSARQTLSKKAWAFISGGTNDSLTRNANNAMLQRIWLRPTIMRDVSTVTAQTTLFGCKLSMPCFISPTGGAKMGGSEGELTLAKAAAAQGIVHCFATPSSYPHSEILDVTPERAFFQLYVNKDRAASEAAIRAADATGKIKAIFVTVDVPVVPKRDDDERVKAESQQETLNNGAGASRDKKGAGLARQSSNFIDSSFNWEDIKWIRGITDKPIVVKGIQRASDAKIAQRLGCDGIVLSNHGGRAADTAPPGILTLLELHKHCPEVFDEMTVLVDGGFRRGGDVVKAICLGASAVGFGRSFLYSLQFGQEGVEHAMESK
jgi:L-lactate dehydrogenase (cytochrome)